MVTHKLTAIVPVHNGRAFLQDAIESIRAQTLPVDELIVVDDASTDDSADIARALGATVIRFDSNRGPSAARNAALAAATGDLVAFLDADDTWYPRHCELLFGILDQHPSVALVASRTQLVSPSDERPGSPPLNEPFDALPYLIRDNFVTQSAVMARRGTIIACGGYDERMRFSEDYELWLRLAMDHAFVHLRTVTVERRVHPAQATWNNMLPLFEATWKLRLQMLENAALVEDQTRLARVVAAAREAADIDYGLTWRALDAASFDLVARAVARVPGTRSLWRRWRRRRQFLWHAWSSAVRGIRVVRSLRRKIGRLS
jgi:glycosyltransferase involved in cell wall biosynthesis